MRAGDTPESGPFPPPTGAPKSHPRRGVKGLGSNGSMPREADLEALATELPRTISSLARMLYGASGSALPRGMRSVLFALSAEPLCISEVAEQEGIGQPSATRMVARLEALDLVRRERAAHDRRVVMVSLTPSGEQTLERMREQSRRVMRDILQARSARELQALAAASQALGLLSDLIRDRPA